MHVDFEPEMTPYCERWCVEVNRVRYHLAVTSPPSVAPEEGRSRTLLLALALAAVAALVFVRAVGYGFIGYDDPTYVTQNEMVLRGVTAEGLWWSLGTFHGSTWLPLTWLSHMLDVSLFGTSPAGHHGTSVALHAINAALAFLVLRSLTGRTWPALVAAALWALHPLRVESVAWVACRKDLVSGLFFLLTLWTWQRWTERPGVGRYVLCALCLAFGLMAKQVLITVPCVLLLLDLWPLARYRTRPWSRLVIEKLPLFALVVVAAIIAQRSQSGNLDAAGPAVPLLERISIALSAYGSYLWQTLVPTDLIVSYARPEARAWILPVVVLVIVSAVLIKLRKRAPALLVGWLWFLGMLVPMLGLVRFGFVQAHADRFTYLAHLGLFAGFAFGVSQLVQLGSRRLVAGLAVAASLVLAAGTWIQVDVWRDDESLWRNSLDHADTVMTRYNLGIQRRLAGDPAQAIEHLEQAVRFEPGNARCVGILVGLYSETGRSRDAMTLLLESIEHIPDDFTARVNLATLLEQHGNPEAALPHLAHALKLQPEANRFRLKYASLLGAHGRPAEGAAVLAPLAEGPDPTPRARLERGRLLGAAGRWSEAVESIQGALELRPGWGEALELLATARERAGS